MFIIILRTKDGTRCVAPCGSVAVFRSWQEHILQGAAVKACRNLATINYSNIICLLISFIYKVIRLRARRGSVNSGGAARWPSRGLRGSNHAPLHNLSLPRVCLCFDAKSEQ